MRFAERGARFSPDGACKFFVDMDGPLDSHGRGVRDGRAAPSLRLSIGNGALPAAADERNDSGLEA